MNQPPLVVDLDGTLLRTDMLHEHALRIARDRPLQALAIPVWLLQGKAVLKQQLARRVAIDPATLPYNPDLLSWLAQQRSAGRRLILCTASDQAVADGIARHLNLFDDVMASDGRNNLSGAAKATALCDRFGEGAFDYAGNSRADLAVWARTRRAIVVAAPAALVQTVRQRCSVEQEFAAPAVGLATWGRLLRVHQWLKNLLLLAPLLAAHQLYNGAAWLSVTLAMACFSLCASAVYVANDLLDLDSDRLHPRKRLRPFASGLIPVKTGVVLAPLLLAVSLLLAPAVSAAFWPWLLFYFALTSAYSWGLKRLMLLDCQILALLYTVRVIAGAAAAAMPLTFWLLAFSVFLFLSLAFVKRYAELQTQLLQGELKVHGRGYCASDAPLVQMLGVGSGYAAALVLALYLNSEAVVKLYRAPELVWGAVPVLLFWISRMWMQAHRGLMHDDPVVYAIKDKGSLLAGGVFTAFLVLGTMGVAWLR